MFPYLERKLLPFLVVFFSSVPKSRFTRSEKNFELNLFFEKKFLYIFWKFWEKSSNYFFVFLSTIHCPCSKLQSSSPKDNSGIENLLKRKLNNVKKIKLLPNSFVGVARTAFNTTRGKICEKKGLFLRKLLICVFVFVLAGWNSVLLPQNQARLSKRVPKHNPRKNILVGKKRRKMAFEQIFPDIWLKVSSVVGGWQNLKIQGSFFKHYIFCKNFLFLKPFRSWSRNLPHYSVILSAVSSNLFLGGQSYILRWTGFFSQKVFLFSKKLGNYRNTFSSKIQNRWPKLQNTCPKEQSQETFFLGRNLKQGN